MKFFISCARGHLPEEIAGVTHEVRPSVHGHKYDMDYYSIEIETLEQLAALAELIGERLILDFERYPAKDADEEYFNNTPSIMIYNGYIE